jgi:hypothetical protein
VSTRPKSSSAPLSAFALRGPARIAAAADGAADKRPTFAIDAYGGGALRLMYWYYPVVIDLKGLSASRRTTVLLEHDYRRIVGQSLELQNDRRRLTLSGIITGDTDDPNEAAHVVVTHARNGFVWAASVGVSPEVTEPIAEGQKVRVNGQEFSGPLTVVRKGRLGEVSLVAVGADETGRAKVAASGRTGEALAMNFEQWLEAQGFDPASLSGQQKTSLKAAFAASSKPPAQATAPQQPAEAPAAEPTASPPANANPGVDPHSTMPAATPSVVAAMRAEAAAETLRIAALRKVCAGKHNDIEAKAIREGWTPEKCELEVLRASRAAAPAIHMPQPSSEPAVIEAALCRSLKLPGLEKHYKPQTLEASERSFRRGFSGLHHLLSVVARANGWSGESVRDDMRSVLRAAFSTMDISGILSNVANKFLLAAFTSLDQTWRQIAAIRPVNTFHQVESYRLTDSMDYEKVGPTGELKHGKLGEDKYTNQVETYGKLFRLTRTHMVNDDLGALQAIPTMLGLGAARALNKVFWKEFLDNASFFAAGNNNYLSGAATALSFDALASADALFRKQKDSEGNLLGVTPRIVLTPSDLAVYAEGWTLSPEYRELQDSTATGKAAKQLFTRNVHAGKWRPVSTAYLQDAAFTGYSAKAWYLLADPMELAAIEVAFLNGQEMPTIESADADFDELGVQFRGYHDFGARKQDHRAGVKMKGEA